MDHNACRGILNVEPLSHSGHNHNREFQSFTLMDTHQTNCIRLLIVKPGFPKVYIIFLELINITDKMIQSLITGCLKCLCPGDQHIKIRAPSFSSWHCRDIIPVSCLFHDLPQEIMDCRVRYPLPEIKEPSKYIAHFFQNARRKICLFFRIRCFQYILIKWYFCIQFSDLCQFLICHSSKRRFQHRNEWNVLTKIIKYTQIVHHPSNFQSFKIPICRFSQNRYSLILQNSCNSIGPPCRASCQDYNILIAYRSQHSRFFIYNLLIFHQLSDSLCDQTDFQLFCRLASASHRKPGILFLTFCIQKKDFCLILFGFRVRSSHIKCSILIVCDPSKLFGHDLSENEVYRIQHFCPASEIFVQIDSPVSSVRQTVGIEFFHEKLRP